MKVVGSCKGLHKSPVLLDNLIDCWFHFYFFELLGCEPDKTDETFFLLNMRFFGTHVLDQVQMNVLIDSWMPCFVSCGK